MINLVTDILDVQGKHIDKIFSLWAQNRSLI